MTAHFLVDDYGDEGFFGGGGGGGGYDGGDGGLGPVDSANGEAPAFIDENGAARFTATATTSGVSASTSTGAATSVSEGPTSINNGVPNFTTNVTAASSPNYCDYQGSAPSPQQYADQGKNFATGINALGQAYGPDVALPFALGDLVGQFHQGGPLDAQTNASGNGFQKASYGNYVYGAFFGGAGVDLNSALDAANLYGLKKQVINGAYSRSTLDGTYTHLPVQNVQAIIDGYTDARAGTLCHNP